MQTRAAPFPIDSKVTDTQTGIIGRVEDWYQNPDGRLVLRLCSGNKHRWGAWADLCEALPVKEA